MQPSYCLITTLPAYPELVSITAANGNSAGEQELLLKLPSDFKEAYAVKATLELYKETCSHLIIALLISLYLFLQVNVESDLVHYAMLHALL